MASSVEGDASELPHSEEDDVERKILKHRHESETCISEVHLNNRELLQR